MVLALFTHPWWPSLPDFTLLFGVLLLFTLTRSSNSFYLIGVLIGGLLVSSAAHLFYQKSSTALSVETDTIIAGKVHSLFISNHEQTRILFEIDSIQGQTLDPLRTFNASLYWRTKEPIKQGQRWALTARLREPYGRVNEAGFDAETFYLSRHIHAKGSVLSSQLLDASVSFRQTLFDRVYLQINAFPSARFLVALAFGERALLTQDDWTALRNTGLAHLLAISGLHIGLAFLFGWTLSRGLLVFFSRSDRLLYWPLWIGLMCALGYAWAAGFSLTAQRALIALFVFSLIRQKGYSMGPFQVFFLVLSAVLIVDPFSVFSASFWLSFWAVFILCTLSLFPLAPSSLSSLSSVPLRTVAKVKLFFLSLFKMQCFLAIGMFPIMSVWFDGLSVGGFFFNLVAVPWVSLVTVPLVLLALIFSSFFNPHALWFLADVSLRPLLWLLGSTDSGWLPVSSLSELFPLIFVCMAFVFYLVKKAQYPALFGVFLVILVFWKTEKAPETDWRVDVFDVGHGLAVLIEHQGEAILYDTGGAWGKGSIAQGVIDPILKARDLTLDGLILSHNDNDHAGGADWLRQTWKPNWERTAQTNQGFPCVKGESWDWHHLNFEVLHPEKRVMDPENEDSCVIRVFDGKHALLLTGDLPKKQERALIEEGALIEAEVLLVPHHGSKSSSSEAFLSAVRPDIAIVSTGRYTPWKLPHPEIFERYKNRNIAWYDTAKQGQISVRFSNDGWKVLSQRFDLEPFWYRKMFGPPIRKE